MTFTIAELADALGLSAVGDVSITVTGVTEPALAGPDQLALAMKPEFADQIAEGAARAAILPEGAPWQDYGLQAALLATRPRFAMSGLSAMMDKGPGYTTGIHPSAIIDPEAEVGIGVSVGPFTVIAAGARIGAGTVIGPQCYIGTGAQIGRDSLLHAGVRIGHDVTIGDRFIGHFGAAIGADGFSFVTPEPSGVEKARATLGDQGETSAQSWARIHSLGGVQIGSDVEIGANACVDRGTVRATRIGDGTKLDNVVQLGHNVVVGSNTLLCALVGIGGSTRIGNNVVLGGQTGVGDNIFIGDNVITGGATKVLANVPAGRVMLGYPAMKMDTHLEIYRLLRRLPRLFADVAALKKSVPKAGGKD